MRAILALLVSRGLRERLDIVHDLEKSAALIEDPARRERLDAVIAKLKACQTGKPKSE
jgi:hypothetical protein